MKRNTLASLLALSFAAGCGTEPERVVVEGPLPAVEDAPPDEALDAAIVEAVTAVAQTFAVDSLGSTVYALEVRLDDVGAAPVGEPFEAAAERDAHIFILGSTPYVPPSPLCDRLVTIPGEDGPCADIVIPLLANPVEVGGVIVLTSNADMITGQLDAFVRDDVDARANFAVRAP